MTNEVENYDSVIDNSSSDCSVSDSGTDQNNSSTGSNTIANIDSSNNVSSDSQIDDSSNVSSTCVSMSANPDSNTAMSDLATSEASECSDNASTEISIDAYKILYQNLIDQNSVSSASVSVETYTLFDKPLDKYSVVETELLIIVLVALSLLTIKFLGVMLKWFH